WVEELIEIAGGEPAMPELRERPAAKDRVVAPADVVARDPEVIIGSWCGRPMKKETVRAREGFEQIAAVRSGHIYEVKSSWILQPGPGALTEGVRQLHAIFAHVMHQDVAAELRPLERTDPDLELLGR